MANTLFTSCLEKQEQAKNFFCTCTSPEARYQKIMELGRLLSPFPESLKIDSNRVAGCQSLLYLSSALEEDKIVFKAYSDALISAGLAYLVTFVYSGEPPEVVLTCPAAFLEDLALTTTLSPNRSNGLSSLLLSLQQRALKFLI